MKQPKKLVSRDSISRSLMVSPLASGLRGTPSGMVSNRKPGEPSRLCGPPDSRRRSWTNSVLTKVIWRPLWWRSSASLSMAFMWLWSGNGITMTCGFFSAVAIESMALLCVLNMDKWE
ncbi:hypothetical protein HanOQP8_Chr09g0335811 [Helianthus annuus]|nr:hypothetical protein HanIR_Chr09g0434471 [Helianthus annuus]KAJ0712525.1 hypothetical protein HanOQP8_Chr09g0335811 [Helianthus annuus]